MTFGGIIFDCDGTLADTMPLHWEAWCTVSERHGFQFSKERFYALGGVPSQDILKMINEEQNLNLDAHQISKEKEEAYLPNLGAVYLIEPVIEVAFSNHGKVPMAVATGGTRKIISQLLARLEIDHLFDHLVTSEDVSRQKPAPDIFLEAACRINVPPEKCLAYEDTNLGLQAIASAGMKGVDVRRLRAELSC
ncbi:MAG: Fructose-1-phosphate phosphatase YqaB [Verrucomicrobia subdivision 3 bacterium]|nr:Fructose-1-phosphate phosphatase YqaB [Limisphaerales bacterium]MCS1412523.1 Fructose-1-phosphate phosphatase YqaB [Limisphaerales bacterium]